MRAAFVTVVVLALAGCAAAQEPSKDELAPAAVSPTGVKWWKNPSLAARANNLTAFEAAANDAGLKDSLALGNLTATVFAPTNAAMTRFVSVDTNVVTDIVDDRDKLTQVLKYHVVPGATLSVARIKELVAKNPAKKMVFTTLQGEPITATVNGTALMINGLAVATPVDVQGGKTILIALDGVALPPKMTPDGLPSAPISGAAGAAASLLLAAPALLALLL